MNFFSKEDAIAFCEKNGKYLETLFVFIFLLLNKSNLSYKKYPDHEKIYTDGSKSDSAFACTSVPMPQEIDEEAKVLPADASIFTAEAAALDMALSAIGMSKRRRFVILSDSLSCLLALKAHEALDPRILKLKLEHSSLFLNPLCLHGSPVMWE